MRILALGGAGVDTLIHVADLPVPFVDTVHGPPFERFLGHSGCGWAWTLAQLGHPVALADLMGDDLEGAFLADALTGSGVDLVPLPCADGTKRSVNLVARDGRRTSFYDGRGQTPTEANLAAARELVDRAGHVHVTINDWTRDALRHATQRPGVTVSTDLHDWDGVNPYHHEFAMSVDVVTLSGQHLDWPSEVVSDILAGGRAQLVALTHGADGATLYTRDERVDVSPLPLPGGVRDTNGAGDAFGAAVLHGWLAGDPLVVLGKRAARVASYVCSVPGTAGFTLPPSVLSD